MINNYPHTSMQDMNLDWIIAKVKELVQEWTSKSENWDKWQKETNEAFADLKSYVMNFFDNLDVQEEIDNKLDEMYNDGKLNELMRLYVPYVTPEMFGAKGDGVTDDSKALSEAYNSGNRVISPTNKVYFINNSINILSSNTFEIHGKIKVGHNVIAFIVGDETHKPQNANILINECECNDKSGILFRIQSAIYNTFRINWAKNFDKVIEIKPIDSCGENIFYPHLWYGHNIAFHIMGANSWENAKWAEGNQLISGFISGCNYGIKIEANVKYSGMLITTAIDNADVSDSYDYYNDGTESPTYAIANLLLWRFIRLSKCKFNNLDSYWDANLALHSTGSVFADGNITSGKTDKTVISNGFIEVNNSNTSYIDLKNSNDDDYAIRIASENDLGLIESKYGNNAGFNKNGFTINESGTNVISGTDLDVNFIGLTNDTNYKLLITPTWSTNFYVTNKARNGFHVRFETAPDDEKTFDWMMIG